MPLLLLLVCRTAVGQGSLLSVAPVGDIILENCARVNDADVQFAPTLYDDQLVYVTRPRRGNIDLRTRQTYFSLFLASLLPDGNPQRGKRFSVELDSKYNEGPVSFSHDDRVIYFTRTQLDNGATVEDKNGRAHLGIFSAFRSTYDWADIEPMPFNGTDFSNQHPSATADGRRIYFASNRPGGFGGYDIYFSDYQDGRWGQAINLGPEVNTEYNDAFPFIHASGRLFFSSQGHGSRGGYDLFMLDVSGRRWGQLYPLPAPINGPNDELGIYLNEAGNQGYLTSNRPGGMGQDDIYLLRLAKGLESLEGTRPAEEVVTVYDGATSQRLLGAEVWVTEVAAAAAAGGGGPSQVPFADRPGRTGREGTLVVPLLRGRTYDLRVSAPGFETVELRFAYTERGSSRPLAITLRPVK